MDFYDIFFSVFEIGDYSGGRQNICLPPTLKSYNLKQFLIVFLSHGCQPWGSLQADITNADCFANCKSG